MNPSFGALVKYRRQTLGYSRPYLALRVRTEGYVLDVSRLERGEVTLTDEETISALANALQWSPALLNAASRMFSNSSAEGHSAGQPITDDATLPSVGTIIEELTGLQQLHLVLEEWTMDLARRAERLRSRPRGFGDDPFDV